MVVSKTCTQWSPFSHHVSGAKRDQTESRKLSALTRRVLARPLARPRLSLDQLFQNAVEVRGRVVEPDRDLVSPKVRVGGWDFFLADDRGVELSRLVFARYPEPQHDLGSRLQVCARQQQERRSARITRDSAAHPRTIRFDFGDQVSGSSRLDSSLTGCSHRTRSGSVTHLPA